MSDASLKPKSTATTERYASGPPGPILSLLAVLIGIGIAVALLYTPYPNRGGILVGQLQNPPAVPDKVSTAQPAPNESTTPPVTTTVGTGKDAVPTPPPPPPPQSAEKLIQGLTLTFTTKSGASDRRSARMVSLYVAENEPPTPFLAPGPFTATWEGYITLDVWNKITFSADGVGKLTLSVNDKPALDCAGPDLSGVTKAVKLLKGKNHVVVTYESPASGASQIRLLWTSDDFPEEPIPPTAFVHNIDDKPLKAALRLRHGRELIGTEHCTRCHTTEASAQTGLPELASDAPDLRDAGARLRSEWMASWIKDPKSLRSRATMPRMLHGKDDADVAQQASDIAAYLASLGAPQSDPTISPKDVLAGQRHFALFGCVACHSASSNQPAYIELTHLKAKFTPAALVEFLEKPSAHYASIRMPDFNLSKDEALQLAGYLLSRPQEALPTVPGGDAARGKTLVAANGCASCHQLGDGMTAMKAPTLVQVMKTTTKGCLASDAESRGAAPDFALEDDLLDLRKFLATDGSSLARRTPAEFAERRIVALRCTACHERDGQEALIASHTDEIEKLLKEAPEEGAKPVDHNEAGVAQENKVGATAPCPGLTFSGDKLRPEWMSAFIAGKISYRPRPWLNKHMPSFAADAQLIAEGLVEEHGHPPTTPTEVDAAPGTPATAPEFIIVCNGCHALGSQNPTQVFESPGINLGYATKRLQRDYFHRWMRSPPRFDPTTRMPKFPYEDAQYEQVWRYLIELDKKTDFPH